MCVEEAALCISRPIAKGRRVRANTKWQSLPDFSPLIPASIIVFQLLQHYAYCATTHFVSHRCPHPGRLVSVHSPSLAFAFFTPDGLINNVCGWLPHGHFSPPVRLRTQHGLHVTCPWALQQSSRPSLPRRDAFLQLEISHDANRRSAMEALNNTAQPLGLHSLLFGRGLSVES